MITVRFRRSKVFDSKVKTTPEIDAALAEITSIDAWFRDNRADADNVRLAGPKHSRRVELQTKVRDYFQEKLGDEFTVLSWDAPKATRHPAEFDIGGSD